MSVSWAEGSSQLFGNLFVEGFGRKPARVSGEDGVHGLNRRGQFQQGCLFFARLINQRLDGRGLVAAVRGGPLVDKRPAPHRRVLQDVDVYLWGGVRGAG